MNAASSAKTYRKGTHRTVDPAETLARLKPLLPRMGITRLANVTGLDTIGIPVVMAVRPNSRAIAVSQGKGLDLNAAKVSAAMESVEGFHAETIDLPLKLAAYEEIRARQTVADPFQLPLSPRTRFNVHTPMLWIEGHDWLTQDKLWVPFQLVHTSYTARMQWDLTGFAPTSTGLASGNHLLEAVSHGICEVVERDCTTRLNGMSPAAQDALRLDLRSVQDPDCRAVLQRFDDAGVDVAAWNATSEAGIAAIECLIAERSDHPQRFLATAGGAGCHPVPEIALLRALTEAAQSRLTVISGSRDDMARNDYATWRDPAYVQRWRLQASLPGTQDFSMLPRFDASSFEEEITWLLDRVRTAGRQHVIVLDLTKPEFGIPVVRVIVPGMRDCGWPEDGACSRETIACA